MNIYDNDPVSLDDAIVEDRVNCCVCDISLDLIGDDVIVLDDPDRPECNGVFCCACARAVYDAWVKTCREAGMCQHEVLTGDSCEECTKVLKEAVRRYENER